MTLAVQVNGKLRGTVELPRDAGRGRRRRPRRWRCRRVLRALEGKAPRKTIVVPNRIVNVVV